MTTETEGTPDVKQQETDFAAGFSSARGEPPAEAPTAKDEATPVVAETKSSPEVPAKVEKTPAEKVPLMLAGMTETEVKALLDRVPNIEKSVATEISRVFGRFGDIQRELKALQAGRVPQQKISKGALKRLNAEFPELADILEQDLSEIIAAETPAVEAKPDGAFNPAEFEAKVTASVNSTVEKIREGFEKKMLTVLHSDWETVVKKNEFGDWLKSLPEADRSKYFYSDDAMVAAEAIARFKAWKPKPADKPAEKPKVNVKKQERLEQAITPAGEGTAPATTIDDEAAFVSGFKGARG